MWKKLPQPSRSRNLQISSPTLIETTYDNEILQSMSGANAMRTRQVDRAPGLPSLTFESIEPTVPNMDSTSRDRVASSIYSHRISFTDHQYSGGHEVQTSMKPDSRRSGISEGRSKNPNISPPDSPTYGVSGHNGESPDISPVDPESSRPLEHRRRDRQFSSGLPVLLKESITEYNERLSEVSPSDWKIKTRTPSQDPSRLTRWDDFSGEPTTSDTGKVAQVTPGSALTQAQLVAKPLHKQPFSLITKGKELNQARRKLMEGRREPDKDDPAYMPSAREPWKGASGRSAIVNPIQPKSTPQLPPLDLPPHRDSQSAPARRAVPIHAIGSPAVTLPKSSSPLDSLSKDPTIKPLVPLKTDKSNQWSGRKSVSRDPVEQHNMPPGESQTAIGHHAEPGISKPSLIPFHNLEDHRRTRNGETASDYTVRFQNLDFGHPTSRFSTTTYATTEPGSPPDTPRPMGDKEPPRLPAVQLETKGWSAKAIGVTARKPTPSQSSASVSKTLPRSPPEMEASNRIDALQAKLDDLARRRGNIGIIINELTQVVQPSSLAYDLATRSEVKRTVQSLNNELAEIKKEEHDLGLKLLRALKKRDEDDIYSEHSGLWIKRVTS